MFIVSYYDIKKLLIIVYFGLNFDIVYQKRTHANTPNLKGACNEAILFHNLQLSYSSITNWQLIFATKLQPNDRFV